MDNRLQGLIGDYQRAVERAVSLLGEAGIPRPTSSTEWASNDAPGMGPLSGGGTYHKHGFGCVVIHDDVVVDFDFGEHGEIDGIDLERLIRFANRQTLAKYGINSEDELRRLLESACQRKELVYSGYILWFLNHDAH